MYAKTEESREMWSSWSYISHTSPIFSLDIQDELHNELSLNFSKEAVFPD